MNFIASKKGPARLHPRCSRSWKPGFVRNCKIYDFESCSDPDWPLTCPFEVKEVRQGCMRYMCPAPFPPVVPPLPPIPDSSTSSSTVFPSSSSGPTPAPLPSPAQIGAGAAFGIFCGVAVVCLVAAGTIFYCFFMDGRQRQYVRTALRNFFGTGSFFGRFPRSPRRYRPNPRDEATLEPMGHSDPPQQSNPGSSADVADPAALTLQDWANTQVAPFVLPVNRARLDHDLSIPARSFRFGVRALSEPELFRPFPARRYPPVPTHDPNLDDEPQSSDKASPETGDPQVPSQTVTAAPSLPEFTEPTPEPARLFPVLPAPSTSDLSEDPAELLPSKKHQPVVPQPMGRPPSYSSLPHSCGCPSHNCSQSFSPSPSAPPMPTLPMQLLYGPSQPVFYPPQSQPFYYSIPQPVYYPPAQPVYFPV